MASVERALNNISSIFGDLRRRQTEIQLLQRKLQAQKSLERMRQRYQSERAQKDRNIQEEKMQLTKEKIAEMKRKNKASEKAAKSDRALRRARAEREFYGRPAGTIKENEEGVLEYTPNKLTKKADVWAGIQPAESNDWNLYSSINQTTEQKVPTEFAKSVMAGGGPAGKDVRLSLLKIANEEPTRAAQLEQMLLRNEKLRTQNIAAKKIMSDEGKNIELPNFKEKLHSGFEYATGMASEPEEIFKYDNQNNIKGIKGGGLVDYWSSDDTKTLNTYLNKWSEDVKDLKFVQGSPYNAARLRVVKQYNNALTNIADDMDERMPESLLNKVNILRKKLENKINLASSQIQR